MEERLDPALVARVRAAISAEIGRQITGEWSVPFSLDAVAKAAIRETLAPQPASLASALARRG